MISRLLVLVGLLAPPLLLGQHKSVIVGTVTTVNGEPLAGVLVLGSMSKTCCPFKREQAITDQHGQFRLLHPGDVVHFSADKFQPKAILVGSADSSIHVTLEPAKDSLVVPICGEVGPHQRRIGWGRHGLQFNVAKSAFRILGGKPDVDYSRYVVKSKTDGAYLELWFGGYAMSELPEDDKFVSSDKYEQRNVTAPDGRLLGMDSWGRLHDGRQWRQTAVLGAGGSRYQNVTARDVELFDEIVNSLCLIPYTSR